MPNYYIVGTINNWSIYENYKLTQDPTEANRYILSGLYLEANAKIKVKSDENSWYGNETTWTGCGFTLDEDHNVCIIDSDAYNISFYLNSAEGNHIVIGKAEQPSHIEIKPSSFHGLVVTDNGDYYTLSFGSESFDVEKGIAPQEGE